MLEKNKILGKTYEFGQFIGEVIENSKDRETQVYGVGGGGEFKKGKGEISPVSIGSVTILHDDIFLMDKDGNECNFRLQNWDVPVRIGHNLHIGWVVRPSGHCDFIFVRNNNLNSEQSNFPIFGGMSYGHNSRYRTLGYVLVVVLSYFIGSWLILFGGLVANFIFWEIADKKVAKVLENEFLRFIDDN